MSRPIQILRFWSGLAVFAALASGQSFDIISAESLRHPISRKANKALQRVTQQYLAGNDAAMEDQLKHAIELPEAAPYALKMKGLLDLNHKDFQAAEQELRQAAALLPWDAESQALLGYAFFCDGDSAAGAAAASDSLKVNPDEPLAHVVIALVQWETKRLDSGLQHLRSAASYGFLPAQVLLASYYTRTGQAELGQKQWQLAQKDVSEIQDRRVRLDTQRWLESHRAFVSTTHPR